MPDKAKDLHAKLLAWRAEVKAPMPTPNTDIKPVGDAKASGGKGKKAKAE
jgi:hypothetical protein